MTAHVLASLGTLASVVLLVFAGVGIPWARYRDRRDAANNARKTEPKQSKGDN